MGPSAPSTEMIDNRRGEHARCVGPPGNPMPVGPRAGLVQHEQRAGDRDTERDRERERDAFAEYQRTERR